MIDDYLPIDSLVMTSPSGDLILDLTNGRITMINHEELFRKQKVELEPSIPEESYDYDGVEGFGIF